MLIHTHASSIAATLPVGVLADEFMRRIGSELLTVREAADKAQKTPERVGQVIRSKELPAIHIDLNGRGAYLIRNEDVLAWASQVRETAVV